MSRRFYNFEKFLLTLISARACVQIRIYVFRHVARLFEVEGEAEMEKKRRIFCEAKPCARLNGLDALRGATRRGYINYIKRSNRKRGRGATSAGEIKPNQVVFKSLEISGLSD